MVGAVFGRAQPLGARVNSTGLKSVLQHKFQNGKLDSRYFVIGYENQHLHKLFLRESLSKLIICLDAYERAKRNSSYLAYNQPVLPLKC